MFERYDERARRALFFSRYEATQRGSISITLDHLLLAIAREGHGVSGDALARRGLTLETVVAAISPASSVAHRYPNFVEIPFSVEVKRALQAAAQEADALGHAAIGAEHLLLGLLCQAGTGPVTFLAVHGLTRESFRDDVAAAPRAGAPSSPPAVRFAVHEEGLDPTGVDLAEAARRVLAVAKAEAAALNARGIEHEHLVSVLLYHAMREEMRRTEGDER